MLQRLDSDERGIALISVLSLSLVMALLLTAILNYGVGSMRQARDDQDWNAALASAEAGVDDFLYRINRDNAYWQEADKTWSGGAPDPDNDALQDNTFAPVPGDTGGTTEGSFHYDVDASTTGSDGNITVTSTGRVGEDDRTIRVTLRKEGFLDFLYFTEYETLDPTAYRDGGPSDPNSKHWALLHCIRHRYAEPPRHQKCADIYWYGDSSRQDVIDGPFHTNDTIAVNGTPQWLDEATTSDYDIIEAWEDDPDNNDPYYDLPGDSDPTFPDGYPQYREPLIMPPTNDSIKAQTDPVVGGEGCLYLGPTFIRIEGDEMVVRSAETADPDPAKCPINGRAPLPPNGVIHVQSKPSGSDCSETPHPYDLTGDVTVYDCRAGDVFVEGTLDGRLTVSAQNNIVITDNLTYQDGTGPQSDDILGLVAVNFIEIFHPVALDETVGPNGERKLTEAELNGWPATRPAGCNDTFQRNGDWWCRFYRELGIHDGQPFREPVVDAAILSLAHSFRVQNFNKGHPLDVLHVTGAMAQKFRGPVGTFSGTTTATGYQKDYVYDDRLKFLSPPYFIDPVKSAWQVVEWSEEQTPVGL